MLYNQPYAIGKTHIKPQDSRFKKSKTFLPR